ncbi:aspartate carbamoyltransferase [Candidatus Woesearchaeota archaeon]|nr:aspartate carbamoyltransferase [Candidatus Woesearchaeota archaeon]
MRRSNFRDKDIISINDLSKDEIIHVLETAKKIEQMSDRKKSSLLQGKILATLFYEPSTRTRLSFQSAMKKLGGQVLGFADPQKGSFAKGETVYDTIKMMEAYSDVIVIRHFWDGAARVAAEATHKPVINAGDGKNQHPTQTLLDLYTIKKTQGKIGKLHVAMVGDLKYGRTVHSLASALSIFDATLYFAAPESLQMPDYVISELEEKGIKFTLHEKIEEIIDKVDVLYMTRIQKERFPDETEYEKVKNVYELGKSMLKRVKPNLKIMHPLPRVTEINKDVDDTRYAHYFQQAANGIPVRQALLCLTLGVIR